MANMYEIATEYENAIRMVDEDWEITEEWLAKLDSLQLDVKTKALDTSKVITMFDDDVAMIDKEIKRLTKLKNVAKNNKDRLKNFLGYNLEKMWIEKLDLGVFKISFRNSDSVVIDEDVLLPEKYQKVTITPDKVALKKAIKNGENIEWVTIVTKKNLQIK